MDAFNGSGDELSGRAVDEVGAPARDLRFPGKVPSIHGEAVLPTKEQADMAADAGRALPTAVAHFQRVDGHRSRRHGSMSWTSTDRCTAARKWASRTCLSPVLTSCRGSFACSGQGPDPRGSRGKEVVASRARTRPLLGSEACRSLAPRRGPGVGAGSRRPSINSWRTASGS